MFLKAGLKKNHEGNEDARPLYYFPFESANIKRFLRATQDQRDGAPNTGKKLNCNVHSQFYIYSKPF